LKVDASIMSCEPFEFKIINSWQQILIHSFIHIRLMYKLT